MKTMMVRIVVCGLCVSEDRPQEERFRAADSERGRRSVGLHIFEDHSAAAVNALLLQGVNYDGSTNAADE